MYLKRIELQGFKSFADKTVLEFGQGVTSVVGPNGSGKSNISDAIRWVMGEMSAKSLRGSNMQDVIFAGTENRKPVNFAEVSLVLDNTARMFPIEFDEIMVTRRVFRSGESVYQINKANCRLKDIVELFMDTGIGRDGYSMIGQGNVSQILSTKAEDRRSFFEEAAGVSKFKHRKDEAERKLSAVNDNLVRINDITSELEGQLKPLENQSKKAHKYLLLYGEYKELDVSMCLVNLEKNKGLLKNAEEEYESISGEIEDLKSKETEIEKKRNELYEKSGEKDEEQAKKNNELIESESVGMAAANEISIAENDIKNNIALSERIDNEISAINKENDESKKQIEEIRERIKTQEEESAELLKVFDNIRADNESLFSGISSLRDEIDGLKGDIIEKMNAASAEKAKIAGMESMRKSFLERREAVEAEKKSHGMSIDGVKSELDKNMAEIEEKSGKCKKLKSRIDELSAELEKNRTDYDEKRRKIDEMNVSLNSKTSQKRMLEGMENSYEGYAKSVKTVLQAQELKRLSIYGTLSGLVDVSREYVTAIETALGGAMQNIVVESEEDAKEAIAYLKKTHSGRATFLPVSSVKGRTLDNVKEVSAFKGFVGIASELLSYDKKYDGIIKSLLGRVVVVDNIDNGIALSRKFGYKFKTVTLGGDILNAGGSMSGGSVNKSAGFLSRAGEIKILGADIASLTAKIRDMREENEETESDIKSINTQLSGSMPLVREYENDLLVLENTCRHLRQTLENSDSSEKALADELLQIEKQLSESGDEIAELIAKSRRIENEIEEKNKLVAEKEEECESLSKQKDDKTQELMDETLRLKELEGSIRSGKDSIAEIERRIASNETLLIEKNEDKKAFAEKNKELSERIDAKNEEIEAAKKLSESIKERIAEIEKEKAGIVEGLKKIQNNNKDVTDRMLVLQQALSRAENKQTKIESDTENIINRLWDDYELTPTAAQEVRCDVEDEQETARKVQELRGKIKALGSVNVDAIEEYKSVSERYEFLTKQKNDLEESRENLNKVIDSTQELMEEHFQKQFEEINKSFSHVFTELFGGGSGRLYLSDPNDVMESGIEIVAQLPGKSTQNLSLYSGGEKSFIAIALLFAILEVKPTPFCILDEIDAALDDVNVSRFATYLKNYLAQTQFIVITHRRGTMEAANIMYGVTMQEKGVSKLLSLKIDEVDDDMLK